MVASPSPACSPYEPNWAWLPPSISTNVVSGGSCAAEASISSRDASPSSDAEMDAHDEVRATQVGPTGRVGRPQDEAVDDVVVAVGVLGGHGAAQRVPADHPRLDLGVFGDDPVGGVR